MIRKCSHSRLFPNNGYGHFAPDQKGFKSFSSKDRLTLVLAVNSTGSIRIPPLIIGKTLNPVCFHTNGWGPLPYKSQPNAWMTTAICRDWFANVFIPEVKHFFEKKETVYLIMDNCPRHPPDLDAKYPFVQVLFLPPNCTSVFQPLDLGIIESLKRRYRHNLMSRLAEVVECWSVAQANSRSKRRGDRGIVFGSPPTVEDTFVMVKETWESLPSVTIICWLKAPSTYLSAASLHFLKNKVEDANYETKKPGK